MYARVARWEGHDREAIRQFAQLINSSDGPPEGVPSSGILVLSDEDSGRSLVIGLFDTEDDLRAGDAALNAMDRPPEARGDISSIEFYEVTADRRLADRPA
jgi:hypothetical protein